MRMLSFRMGMQDDEMWNVSICQKLWSSWWTSHNRKCGKPKVRMIFGRVFLD